jgi:hypothetical protein
VLLEAARAAGDSQAAATVIAFVRETRLEDPVIEALVREIESRRQSGGGAPMNAAVIRLRSALRYIVAIAMTAAMPNAHAHSASDAYLTLEGVSASGGETVVRAQWDIALRDLDFVLGLDANGDGIITWRELRERQEAVARYAYGFVSASAGGKACSLRPVRQRVANHADGAYAALSFDIVCPGGDSR